MADRIVLKNIVVHAFHGVHAEEARLGQRFEFDVACVTDTRDAGTSDDYSRALCYESLFRTVEDVATGSRYHLLEALAETVAARILERFETVSAVDITVRKPQAPIAGMFDFVAVEIFRERQ
ncbi:dihydroneopterin aldolase [Rhodobium orientis]|uniref:7,8-dihydroneopterin aldolase n=1 Tax=Rhodobium orientis TaxID=34017 RepID=A0A327JIT1_9HYPH|nr:dihydroneopterin aldolase [Rhodobium orientis]MBB4305241.1 dihydroneopterin aldolase [Rhodobium orientis]MBK5952131.1 dihydroneopterin aldolase [Rhodobium orientis]RAI26317.1 dihydroneopterin aldolase [Rhodobium orientis]